MELGGNAPFIVFEDADIEVAINIGSAIKFQSFEKSCFSVVSG